MSEISLRAYIRDIEKQVDSGRTDEAIAHCRHVLESYPKYIEAYRLLGKAFLESQRFGDAADIFQRVLSSTPDDFVSHVGMSIIREDEGNLDEAIWHMERAFEVQPSNGAIQEELRRLHGKRDNIEPPKVRLTRGALARMYFKGELSPRQLPRCGALSPKIPPPRSADIASRNLSQGWSASRSCRNGEYRAQKAALQCHCKPHYD